jgi:hypothetical protein
MMNLITIKECINLESESSLQKEWLFLNSNLITKTKLDK